MPMGYSGCGLIAFRLALRGVVVMGLGPLVVLLVDFPRLKGCLK